MKIQQRAVLLILAPAFCILLLAASLFSVRASAEESCGPASAAYSEQDKEETYTFFGEIIPADTTSLYFRKLKFGDEGLEQLRELLPLLPKLKELQVDRCGQSDEAMAQLREDFPDIRINWRVFFGPYTCMTDAERIWITAYEGYLTDKRATALRYCTACKYLDLGHNDISDISFVSYMPDLEVVILSMNQKITDISPLADCPKLEFAELTLLNITDLTPLSGLKNLRHLELSQIPALTDISPLYGLELERLHIMYNHGSIPKEQFDAFMALHPACRVNFSNGWEENPYVCSNWRYEPDGSMNTRYALLREQIGYDDPNAPSVLYDY